MDSFLGNYLSSLAALAGGTFLRSIGTGELCTAQHSESPPGHLYMVEASYSNDR